MEDRWGDGAAGAAPPRRFPIVGRFALAGGAFGCLFPLVAWALTLWTARAPWTPARLWRAHMDTPVLWIVDLAPLVLGLAGAALGVQHWQLRLLHAHAERRATHDPLTGLPNRALLNARLDAAIRAPARDGATPALLLLDLDRFKEVNDTLGHQAGDALLVAIAGRLRVALRGAVVARLGGDEFAALLPATHAAGAAAAARAVIAAVEAPLVVGGQALAVGASVGIARCPDHGRDATTLLRCADIAMYAAKRGHHGHAAYDPAQDGHDAGHLALVADLRAALVEGQLRLHYQPIVDLPSGAARGVEALVRWAHPARGLVPPDVFVPLAEQAGLIDALAQWVLAEALQQRAAWADAGLDVTVAVNLSLRNLRDRTLVDTVAAALARYGSPPARLCLELTESVVMADVEGTRATLERLAALGVRLAIDDFGTGYSSLAYLSHLPVDELKIDRSFVRRMAAHAPDQTIVASTIGLGHSLGLRVVTEGVEDRETWALLARLGADAAQGYYFAQPLPADEIAPWLRRAAAVRGARASA
jgi:diguanylate cyclase (GGDEF)-like protein